MTDVIEVFGLNVTSHGIGKEVGAGVAVVEAFAEGGGGNIFGDSGEDVDAGALGGGEGERGEGGFGEAVAGAGDDDPFGEVEEAVGLVPLAEAEEGVGADEVEKSVMRVLGGEGGERVDGVVGGGVGVGGIDARRGEAGVGFRVAGLAGGGDEGEAGGEGCGFGRELEWLEAGGGEEDAVEGEGVGGGAGDGDVAAVGWVEGAAEEGYAHGYRKSLRSQISKSRCGAPSSVCGMEPTWRDCAESRLESRARRGQ